jgi:hypothetical protein
VRRLAPKLLLDEHIWEGLAVVLAAQGYVLSVQLSRSALLKQATRLLQTLTADELANTVRWLQEFK